MCDGMMEGDQHFCTGGIDDLDGRLMMCRFTFVWCMVVSFGNSSCFSSVRNTSCAFDYSKGPNNSRSHGPLPLLAVPAISLGGDCFDRAYQAYLENRHIDTGRKDLTELCFQ